KRELLNETQQAYLSIISKQDWPSNIEQVYLDGNNMMFVIDSLRRLCLNRHGKKTEQIIGQIASAWNEKLQIPHVNLIYDSTKQVETIGTVNIQSAQPKYKTTDDMLVDLAKQNHGKNEHTIVVTADRALAAQLKNEGCQLVKPYHWFAHCVMLLTPDLIKQDPTESNTSVDTTTKTRRCHYNKKEKIHYDFDELVKRVANIDI
ncbi:unnamed protein product, partial [Didymodactylos carnosus]